MKKNTLISILSVIIIVAIACYACSDKPNEHSSKSTKNTYEYIPYEQLPADYDLENAKLDGCVVFENLQLTSGDEVWQQFLEKVQAGESSSIRLAYYYTLDSQNISEEYYAEVKDEYPVLYVQDLSFDGETYHLYYTENEQIYEYEYPYLVKYTGTPNSSTAIYSEYVRYFLVRDKDITFEQIQIGWFSSYTGNQVDCVAVYTDLIR
ncbi:MAG: hypothetical protein PHU66_09435 [Bacteroidaceae bacterium]|nr:hypothetical protein [Bacteroidaceae bacterium]